MAKLNQSTFPFQIDKVISDPSCLEFIRSFIDYEEFDKMEDLVNKINSTPDLKKKYGENIRKVSRGRKKFNLNLGLYSPGKKIKGEVVKDEEITSFYELIENRNPKLVKLPEPIENKGESLTSETLPTKPRRSSFLSPSRWSMKTANYTKERSGIAIIIPNNITAKSRIVRVYCGYRYGQMMGHGSLQIWRRKDSGWKLSSTKGTWIS